MRIESGASSNYAGTTALNQHNPQPTRCLRGLLVGLSDETKGLGWPVPVQGQTDAQMLKREKIGGGRADEWAMCTCVLSRV